MGDIHRLIPDYLRSKMRKIEVIVIIFKSLSGNPFLSVS